MHKILAILLLMASTALAGYISATGTLADANDNATIQFTVTTGGTVTFQSWGYGGGVNAAGTTISSGNFDPYLSLFRGIGPTAVYIGSNDDGTCPPGNTFESNCYDSGFSMALTPGDYTLAITVAVNMSFAENNPALYNTLGDGFLALQDSFGSNADRQELGANWAVDISGESVTALADSNPVPEPATITLVGMAFGGIWIARRKVRRA